MGRFPTGVYRRAVTNDQKRFHPRRLTIADVIFSADLLLTEEHLSATITLYMDMGPGLQRHGCVPLAAFTLT